jgi:O-methyltransferase domain
MTRRKIADIYGGPAVDESLESRMLRLGSGHFAAQAIHVFAKLDLADLLRDGDKTSDELARRTGSNEAALSRLLKFLATVGVVSELDGASFSLTQLGRTLCSRPSPVIRDNVLLMCSPAFWSGIGNLFDAVKTGDNAFEGANRRGFFDYLEHHPEVAALFNAAMTSSTQIGVAPIVSTYDFSGVDVIVDVAGGHGSLLEAILKREPHATGILFDAASVVEKARFSTAVAGRVSTRSGNFFEGVPEGAGMYILRRVLHDWNDDKATEILRRCREAARPDTKLLVIEAAPPDEGQSANNWAGADLLMMILMDGRERTAADFEQLLARCGFELKRTVRTNSAWWIVEATPV